MVEPVLPAHLRELSGTLSSIQGSLPRGSEVQMALLVIDERDRPQRLLASETVLATGELMPFRLPFNPESFLPAGGALRVELHARVIQSGQLAWRLHPLRIAQPTTQSSANCAWYARRDGTASPDPGAGRAARRRPAQRHRAARHRPAPVADRRAEHGPPVQPGGNPPHPRRAAVLVLLLGQRAGPGALAGGAPAVGPRQARAGLRQRLRGGGDRRGPRRRRRGGGLRPDPWRWQRAGRTPN